MLDTRNESRAGLLTAGITFAEPKRCLFSVHLGIVKAWGRRTGHPLKEERTIHVDKGQDGAEDVSRRGAARPVVRGLVFQAAGWRRHARLHHRGEPDGRRSRRPAGQGIHSGADAGRIV